MPVRQTREVPGARPGPAAGRLSTQGKGSGVEVDVSALASM
jgi:hypothetical protein